MTDPQTENANHLRARYARRVLDERPDSVLDVGCGGGIVLGHLRDGGVRHLAGFETDPDCRQQLRKQGFTILEVPPVGVPPETLPTADATFDWVILRHVPHHLEDPTLMVQEAFRVARTGVVLAEPFFDRAIPSQAVAEDLDLWLKREHRRHGQVHAPNFDSAGLLALVPTAERRRLHVSWDRYTRQWDRPLSDIKVEAEPYLDKLPDDASERDEFSTLFARAEEVGLTCNGSLTMVLRRPT